MHKQETWSNRWETSRQELLNAPHFILPFMRKPLDHVTMIPNWNWLTLIIMQASLAGLSGILSGLFSRSFINVLAGIFLFPITAVAGVLIVAAFFYYTFHFFKKVEVPMRKLVAILVVSNVYYMAFRMVSPIIPAAELIGIAFSAVVVIVGISDNFAMDRKFVIRVVVSLYVVIFLSWAMQMIQHASLFSKPKPNVTPESWDILEREVNSTN